jgi:hypothetical protein
VSAVFTQDAVCAKSLAQPNDAFFDGPRHTVPRTTWFTIAEVCTIQPLTFGSPHPEQHRARVNICLRRYPVHTLT